MMYSEMEGRDSLSSLSLHHISETNAKKEPPNIMSLNDTRSKDHHQHLSGLDSHLQNSKDVQASSSL